MTVLRVSLAVGRRLPRGLLRISHYALTLTIAALLVSFGISLTFAMFGLAGVAIAAVPLGFACAVVATRLARYPALRL